jgi:hypothetical protein
LRRFTAQHIQLVAEVQGSRLAAMPATATA